MDGSSQRIRWQIELKNPLGHEPEYVWPEEKTELMIVRENRNGQSRIRVFHSLCPHMGARLQWESKTGKVHCPWHGLSFCGKAMQSDHHLYKKIREYPADLMGNSLTVYDV